MANIRLIRRRIRGVQSTSKITRAMEMIATSKMKRAQEAGVAGRPYDAKICQLIADLASVTSRGGGVAHPLFRKREEKKIAIVHITPDRGLTGGLNGNINRKTLSFIDQRKVAAIVVLVGRKGIDFIRRTGLDIRAEFFGLGDKPGLMDTTAIARVVMNDYNAGLVDAVYLTFARFVSTMLQIPTTDKLMPIEPETKEAVVLSDFLFEPDASAVLDHLLPRFVEMRIYQAILESIASEQSARMVAMRSATENAQELVEHLTLVYNKARQEAITTELLDITGGVAALEKLG